MNLRQRSKGDWVFYGALAAASLALGLALVLVSGNAVNSDWGVSLTSAAPLAFVNAYPQVTINLAVAAAISLVIYAFSWRHFSNRLPQSPSQTFCRPVSLSVLDLIILTTIVSVAVIIRLPRMDRGLDYDELYTIVNFVGVNSVWKTASTYSVFNNHIFYSILTYFSKNLFGSAEWALRLPALILGIGSLCLFWFFSQTVVEKGVTVLATVALAIAPAHVLWSMSARGYSGLLFFTLLSTYIFLQLLEKPTRMRWVLFVFVSTVGIYTHLYAALVLATQIILVSILALGQLNRNWKTVVLNVRSFQYAWLALPAVIIGSFLCYLPVLAELVFWILARARGSFQWYFPVSVVVSWSGLADPVVLALVSTYVIGFVVLWKSRFVVALYFLLLALVPLFIMWLSRPFDLYTRFLFFYLPYYVLLTSLGAFSVWDFAGRQSQKLVRYGLYATCIAVLLWIGALWIIRIQSMNPDPGYRQAVRTMIRDADSTVGLCALGAGAELFHFYADRQIIVPATATDMEGLLGEFSEIRCVYNKANWEAPLHTQIADFLFENARAQKVGDVFVFRYKP